MAADTLKYLGVTKGSPSCQRACRTDALRVARAYHTVSNIALSVIAVMLSIDLIAAVRAKMYRKAKRTEEDDVNQKQSHNQWSRRSSEECQCQWDLAGKSR